MWWCFWAVTKRLDHPPKMEIYSAQSRVCDPKTIPGCFCPGPLDTYLVPVGSVRGVQSGWFQSDDYFPRNNRYKSQKQPSKKNRNSGCQKKGWCPRVLIYLNAIPLFSIQFTSNLSLPVRIVSDLEVVVLPWPLPSRMEWICNLDVFVLGVGLSNERFQLIRDGYL